MSKVSERIIDKLDELRDKLMTTLPNKGIDVNYTDTLDDLVTKVNQIQYSGEFELPNAVNMSLKTGVNNDNSITVSWSNSDADSYIILMNTHEISLTGTTNTKYTIDGGTFQYKVEDLLFNTDYYFWIIPVKNGIKNTVKSSNNYDSIRILKSITNDTIKEICIDVLYNGMSLSNRNSHKWASGYASNQGDIFVESKNEAGIQNNQGLYMPNSDNTNITATYNFDRYWLNAENGTTSNGNAESTYWYAKPYETDSSIFFSGWSYSGQYDDNTGNGILRYDKETKSIKRVFSDCFNVYFKEYNGELYAFTRFGMRRTTRSSTLNSRGFSSILKYNPSLDIFEYVVNSLRISTSSTMNTYFDSAYATDFIYLKNNKLYMFFDTIKILDLKTETITSLPNGINVSYGTNRNGTNSHIYDINDNEILLFTQSGAFHFNFTTEELTQILTTSFNYPYDYFFKMSDGTILFADVEHNIVYKYSNLSLSIFLSNLKAWSINELDDESAIGNKIVLFISPEKSVYYNSKTKKFINIEINYFDHGYRGLNNADYIPYVRNKVNVVDNNLFIPIIQKDVYSSHSYGDTSNYKLPYFNSKTKTFKYLKNPLNPNGTNSVTASPADSFAVLNQTIEVISFDGKLFAVPTDHSCIAYPSTDPYFSMTNMNGVVYYEYNTTTNEYDAKAWTGSIDISHPTDPRYITGPIYSPCLIKGTGEDIYFVPTSNCILNLPDISNVINNKSSFKVDEKFQAAKFERYNYVENGVNKTGYRFVRLTYNDVNGDPQKIMGGMRIGQNHWYYPVNKLIYTINGPVPGVTGLANYYGRTYSHTSDNGNFTVLCGNKPDSKGNNSMYMLFNVSDN